MGTLLRRVHPFFWTTTPQLNVEQGTQVNLNLAAYVGNPQNRTLNYFVHSGSLPAGLTLSGSTVIGTPTTVGTSTPQFRCTDGQFDSVSYAATMVITSSQVNQPPVWNSTPAVTFTEGVAASYDLSQHVTDPDGDVLEFALNSGNLPTGVTLQLDGTLFYDGVGSPDSQAVTIDATEADTLPTGPQWQTVPTVTFTEGFNGTVDITRYSWSPEGTPIYYSAIGTLPDGVQLTSSGDFTYDGIGAAAASTATLVAGSQPPSSTADFKFAEMHEIVFVRGLDETEQMGIFMLDPGNRWTPGDLTRASGWQVALGRDCTLVDANTGQPISDPYVSLDPNTMELTYDSTVDTGVTSYTIDVKLKAEDVLSDAFQIRIMTPTFSWGTTTYQSLSGVTGVTHIDPAVDESPDHLGEHYRLNYALQDYGLDPGETVVLITANSESDAEFYALWPNDRGSVYILGVPGQTVCGLEADEGSTPINFRNLDMAYMKNLHLRHVVIKGFNNRRVVLDNIKLTDQFSVDGCQLDNYEADYKYTDGLGWAWITHCEATRCGAGLKHPFYIHMQDSPMGVFGGMKAQVYVNNLWTYGNNKKLWSTPTIGGQGGINFKATSPYLTIRNMKTESTDNWADPYNSYMSGQVVSVVAQQRLVLYNNHFKVCYSQTSDWGTSDFVIFQNRTTLGGGSNEPGYIYDDVAGEYIAESAGEAPMFMDYQAITAGATQWQPNTQYRGTQKLLLNGTTAAHNYVGDFVISNGRYYVCTSPNAYDSPADPEAYGVSGTVAPDGVGSNGIIDGGVKWSFCPNPGPLWNGSNTYLTAPVSVPYWDNLGDMADPTNENAFNKFFSYNYFEWVELNAAFPETPLDKRPNNVFSDRGTAPSVPEKQGNAAQVYYNCPPNWKERSRAYIANNSYSDNMASMPSTDRYDTSWETLLTSWANLQPALQPYSPGNSTQVSMTIVGGETWPSQPNTPVTLPSWFKY